MFQTTVIQLLRAGLAAATLSLIPLSPALAAGNPASADPCGASRSLGPNGETCTDRQRPTLRPQRPALESLDQDGVTEGQTLSAHAAHRPHRKRYKVDRCSYPANRCH